MNFPAHVTASANLGPSAPAPKKVEVAKSCRLLTIAVCFAISAIIVSAHDAFGGAPREKRATGKSSAQDAGKVKQLEKALVFFTNKERTKADMPVLELSPALNFLARGQSTNMCDKRTLQHESDSFPAGWRKFRDRMKMADLKAGAENVAYRTSSPEVEKWAEEVVEGWMKSPPHRKNILNADFVYLGIGIVNCADNYIYATQVFSPDPGRLP
jgi:uncharacterized protein YkwD